MNFKNKIFGFGQIGNVQCQNLIFAWKDWKAGSITQDARFSKEKSVTWKHKELISEKCIF